MATINTLNNTITDANLTVPGGTITASGDIETTAGNLLMAATTATAGHVLFGATSYLSAPGTRNIFLRTLNTTLTGTDNVGMQYAGNALTTGSRNVLLGPTSGNGITTGVDNVGIGPASLVTGNVWRTIGIGKNTLRLGSGVTFTNNTAIGRACGWHMLTGTYQIAVGDVALDGNTGGTQNIAFGYSAMGTGTGAKNTNIAMGYQALKVCSTGDENVALGSSALLNCNTGLHNIGIGYQAFRTTSGQRNIGIGYQAGYSYTTTESSNICIGNTGTITESNKIRIGTDGSGTGQQDACFIAGINGVTPGGTINYALVDSNHQLGSAAYVASTGWTPVLRFGGGVTGITYGTQTGSYARVDSIVAFTLNIVLTSKGSDNGAATIIGLPISAGAMTTLSVYYSKLTALGMITATLTGATISISSANVAGGAVAALDDTDFADDSSITISGTYIV